MAGSFPASGRLESMRPTRASGAKATAVISLSRSGSRNAEKVRPSSSATFMNQSRCCSVGTFERREDPTTALDVAQEFDVTVAVAWQALSMLRQVG